MTDILFDAVKRDLVYVKGKGFTLTPNPSPQNLAICLYSRGAIMTNRDFGQGLDSRVINSKIDDVAAKIANVKKQILQDGALSVSISASIANHNVNIQGTCQY
jgi:hypothetical protein